MKKNRGVSLIALVILIVVMIILASIAIRASYQDVNKASEAKSKAERSEVATAISARYGDYMINKIANPLVGDIIPYSIPTPEEQTDYLVELFINEGRLFSEDETTNDTLKSEMLDLLRKCEDCQEYTRILRHDDIVSLGVDNITSRSVFLVNYYKNLVVGPIV